MDSIRSMFVTGVTQLVVLGAMVPVMANVTEDDEEHRRTHGRRCSQTISHSREDYPVILNWLTSPDTPDSEASL